MQVLCLPPPRSPASQQRRIFHLSSSFAASRASRLKQQSTVFAEGIQQKTLSSRASLPDAPGSFSSQLVFVEAERGPAELLR